MLPKLFIIYVIYGSPLSHFYFVKELSYIIKERIMSSFLDIGRPVIHLLAYSILNRLTHRIMRKNINTRYLISIPQNAYNYRSACRAPQNFYYPYRRFDDRGLLIFLYWQAEVSHGLYLYLSSECQEKSAGYFSRHLKILSHTTLFVIDIKLEWNLATKLSLKSKYFISPGQIYEFLPY